MEGGRVLEYADPRYLWAWWSGNTVRQKELKQLWTQREPALLRTGAIIGTGLGVSAATGGAGLMPYLYGVGAATSASIALDAEVQARLATGDFTGAADQASYHLPFWGNARSSLTAWQQGDRSAAAFYAALFGLETLGPKRAWRRPGLLPAAANQQQVAGARVTEGGSFVDHVTKIQRRVAKNSVTIPGENPNVRYQYDLIGASHKGAPTPHVQRWVRNVNSKGEVFWNKDRKWVRPMTDKDLKIIEKHLESIKE